MVQQNILFVVSGSEIIFLHLENYVKRRVLMANLIIPYYHFFHGHTRVLILFDKLINDNFILG